MAFNNLENSESSAAEDREDGLSSEERNVQIFAKQMLQGRLFLGHFQEKRWVDQLQGYRDVIVINESETGLIGDIKVVRERLRGFYQRNSWIGITHPSSVGAPNGNCFWTESTNNTFGHYWYKIKNVKFRKKEIVVRLKVVRPMTDNDLAVSNKTKSTDDEPSIKLENLLDNFTNTFRENLIWVFTEAITRDNIKQAVTFLSVLFVTLATSTVYGIGFVMDFMIKLLREISIFVNASTPVLVAVVNLIGKVIGGFYILIAMMWRGDTSRMQSRQLPYQPRRAIEPAQPSLQNRHRRQTLTITEIN